MKGKQNHPNKQVTSNSMTGKPLPFSHCSRSNRRENRYTSRHRSPSKSSHSNSKPYYDNSNFKPPSRNGSPYQRLSNYQKKSSYNTHNACSNNSRPQSLFYNRDGNRPRRPFSHNPLGSMKNCINSILDQAQTDDTVSITENTETQNVLEEQILKKEFNDLLLELNQETQDD